jgi:hemerythrin-like domain-containing protein
MAASAKAAAKKPSAVKKKTAASRKSTAAKNKSSGAVKKTVASRKPTAAKKKSAGAVPTVVRKTSEQPLMKTLRAEHRHMSTVMHLFADQLKAIEAGELVDTHVVYEIMDYMVVWPDRFHHPREDLIYARVAEVNAKAADDVDTLLRDHDQTARKGRALLKDIERWREGSVSGEVVVKNGRAYIDHIFEHMNIEEKRVFPAIEASLSISDWRELSQDDAMQAVANPIFGPGVQREFRNMTRKLRRSVRRSVERGTMAEWIGIEALMDSLEVVSIAVESARGSAEEQVRTALQDSLGFFRESPLSAPLRCVANNTRVTYNILGDVADISRETIGDLQRVNRSRKDRISLLDRDPDRR